MHNKQLAISSQGAFCDDFDLALPINRDFLPLIHGRFADAKRSRQGCLGTEVLDGIIFSHSEVSMAYRTSSCKDAIPLMAYAQAMSDKRLLTITDRILDAMEEAGFERKVDLATACGVSKQTVGDWTSGRTENIRPEHLVKLADVLGVEIRWLATGQGPRRCRKTIPAEIEEAASILGVMDHEQRSAYITILRNSKAA